MSKKKVTIDLQYLYITIHLTCKLGMSPISSAPVGSALTHAHTPLPLSPPHLLWMLRVPLSVSVSVSVLVLVLVSVLVMIRFRFQENEYNYLVPK